MTHWCGTNRLRLRPSRKPTPTLTASSSSRRPHEVIGMAKPVSTVRQGRCQERCSVKRCSQGGFNNDSVCENARSVPEWLFGRQSMRYCTIGCRLSCQVRLQILPDRMPSWRWSVLAADAKNAGIARELTRLTPKPPSFTARLAWSHWVSDKSKLVMRWTAILNSESKRWRDGCHLEGEQCRRWRTLGALKDNLRRIKASCALTPNSVSQPPLLDPRIDFDGRPYNTLTLPCERVILTLISYRHLDARLP